MTNMKRQSGATSVKMLARVTRNGAIVRIEDNGHGMPDRGRRETLGLRNMAERKERLDGTLRILPTRSGTVIEAQLPLSPLLPQSGHKKASA